MLMVYHSKQYFSFWKSNKDTDVIHGDIKPQNVLVFKDATGNTTVKVADFGYATLFAGGEAGRIFLPKSRPWNAPEHHFGEFTLTEAKKTDVYSFGLLCLWVLFSNGLSNIWSLSTKYGTESVSFHASVGQHTVLEQLKYDDQVKCIAIRHVQSVPYMKAEHKIRLKEFFSLTIALNPAKRTPDLGKLVGLLSYNQ